MAEYIDKQAFNDAIREAVRKYPNTFYNGLEVARQIAHDMDAADVVTWEELQKTWKIANHDVAPARQGRWVKTGDFSDEPIDWVACDRCKAKIPDFDYSYCPMCGAKMDGGET